MSFVIPYFALDIFPIYIESSYGEETIKEIGNIVSLENKQNDFNWTQFFFFSYLIIAFIFFIRLVKGFAKITFQILKSNKIKNNHYTIVENTVNEQTFTFFRFLFQPKSKPIDNEVATHEMIHIKQWHTLDIIISEIVKVILWFNPIVYVMQNRIKLNHEFICDSFAASFSTPYKYAQYLSKSIGNDQSLVLTSNFSYKLKNRIIMLQKSIQPGYNMLRYTSIIPVLLVLFFFFSCDEYIVAQDISNKKPSNHEFIKMIVKDTVTTFDSETYTETVQIVKREVDALVITDTVVVFNYDTYEENVHIVRSFTPIEELDSKYLNALREQSDQFKGDFGKDTISTLDYDTGDWTSKVVYRSNLCYGFYWGDKFNNVDILKVKDAMSSLTSEIQVLKFNKKSSECNPIENFKGRMVFVPEDEKIDPMVFYFSNINSKIGNNNGVEKYMIRGTKIYIEDLIVNDEIQLKGKVITIK